MTSQLTLTRGGVWMGRGVQVRVRGGRRDGRGLRGFGGVQVGLLLRLRDILLIADTLVTEPVGHLRHAENTKHVVMQCRYRVCADGQHFTWVSLTETVLVVDDGVHRI